MKDFVIKTLVSNNIESELEKIGVIPKIVRLEENLDPDEYIQKYGKDN